MKIALSRGYNSNFQMKLMNGQYDDNIMRYLNFAMRPKQKSLPHLSDFTKILKQSGVTTDDIMNLQLKGMLKDIKGSTKGKNNKNDGETKKKQKTPKPSEGNHDDRPRVVPEASSSPQKLKGGGRKKKSRRSQRR